MRCLMLPPGSLDVLAQTASGTGCRCGKVKQVSSANGRELLLPSLWVMVGVLIAVWLLQDAFHGIYDQGDYEMADFWDTNFKANLFGAQPPAIKDRSSLETDMPIEAPFPAFARACFLCAATPSGQGHAY